MGGGGDLEAESSGGLFERVSLPAGVSLARFRALAVASEAELTSAFYELWTAQTTGEFLSLSSTMNRTPFGCDLPSSQAGSQDGCDLPRLARFSFDLLASRRRPPPLLTLDGGGGGGGGGVDHTATMPKRSATR